MTKTFRAVIGAAALAAAAGASAQTYNITFDAGDPIGGLAIGATLASQYAAYGVVFAPNAFTGPTGPTGDWGTNTDMTIVSSTGSDVGGLGTPSLVNGKMLHSFSGWLNEDGDPSFSATFAGGITSFSADFAGVAEPADVHLYAYNGATLLSTITSSVLTGQFTLSVLAPRITKIIITPGSFDDWVGVDNIKYTLATVTAPVPEPETYALMGLGLAALAWSRRRMEARRRA